MQIIRMEVCSAFYEKDVNIIGYNRINKFENILVPGVAGGSVFKTLVDEIHFKGKITGAEIDKNSTAIAND